MPSFDPSYRFLAAKHLRKQAKRLAAQMDGARRADHPESVHQARVASRRLRAAMRMFAQCFGPEQLKTWRKQVRRVTDKLGTARDKDVQIEFLREVLEELDEKACYPGVARLLVKLERQRERLQPKVVEAADRLRSGGAVEEMLAVAKQVLSEAKAKELGVQSLLVFDRTRQHILENLDQLLPYGESLDDPEDRPRHHAMRIAAKRLRYTLEISEPVYDGRLSGTVEAVKRLQALLGEVHDCDVWVEDLRRFAAKECKRLAKHYGHSGPFARLQVGIEYLQNRQRQRREEVFRELVEYWGELGRGGVWEGLVETVGARHAGPAVPEAAAGVAPHAIRGQVSDRDVSAGHEVCTDSARHPHSAGEQVGQLDRQV